MLKNSSQFWNTYDMYKFGTLTFWSEFSLTVENESHINLFPKALNCIYISYCVFPFWLLACILKNNIRRLWLTCN